MTLDRNHTINPSIIDNALRIGDDNGTFDINPSKVVRIMTGDESVTIVTDSQNTYTMYMTDIHGNQNFTESEPSVLALRIANDLFSLTQ